MFRRYINNIIIFALFLCIFFIFTTIFLVFKTENIKQERHFIISWGDDIKTISSIINDSGVSTSCVLLVKIILYNLRVMQMEHMVKVGEYKILGKTSLWDVVRKITMGDAVIRNFTVIEGSTNFQIIEKLNNDPYLFGFIDSLNFEGSNIEGFCLSSKIEDCYMFPDTYHFTYGMKKHIVIDMMLKKGLNMIDYVWSTNKNKVLKSKNELLIMASIIEKETQIEYEMSRISGVFRNRLLKRMKLQTDPTVIFAITKGKFSLDRPLNREDLKMKDPYNTYYIYGLPPKPICNPGLKALIAASNPMDTDDLYFVANGNGGHYFSKNIHEHIKNIKNK